MKNFRLIIPFIILLTAGCSTLKQSTKQVEKAYIKYPGMVAEKTRGWFPIKETIRVGDTAAQNAWLRKAEAVIYDLQEKELAIQPEIVVPDVTVEADTSGRAQIAKLQGAINRLAILIRERPVIRDTIYQEDSAKVKAAGDQVTAAREDAAASLKDANNWLKVADQRMKYLIWALLAVILLLLIIIVFVKLRKK